MSEARRRVFKLAGAAGFIAAAGGMASALAAPQRRTASQALGPFYPLAKPADSDADLTLVQGRTRRAQGQVVYVTGRVLDAAGNPLPGVDIEIWQANTHGRYAHPPGIPRADSIVRRTSISISRASRAGW